MTLHCADTRTIRTIKTNSRRQAGGASDDDSNSLLSLEWTVGGRTGVSVPLSPGKSSRKWEDHWWWGASHRSQCGQHAHLYHPTQWSLYHSWTWFSSSNMSNLWPVRMGPISSLFLMCKSIPLKAVPSLWSYHCSIDEPISCLSYTRQNYYMPQHNLSIFGWQAAGVHSRNAQQSSSWTDTSVWTNLFYDLCDVVKPCNWVEVMGMLCAQPQKGDMSLPFISDLSLKWTLYQEQKWQPGNCKSTKECMCILWKNS
jgi:hypothetical protein